ncbi:hypothetical protein Val02_13630 [Virgisporangium aliadipatigenens]|uniref:DUF2470 domain-containing protein n=1 Tax=Virgisporangium aliadipatigenens TaxID=741659 RepID=A0A8J3YHE7_9ACTN|nr:DUF2470 domain-containing protein [Virgisporangium aliadipatigenens]GIJ44477.1 hypothetical protein Val02_13630 [Virgisporangium aliadipatigenens]
MGDRPASTTAERLRTLLLAESSLDVVAAQRRVQLIGRHEVGNDGLLKLSVPGDSVLAFEIISSGGRLPALIEITDVAAVAMRDRVRARASLAGALSVVPGPVGDGGTEVTVVLELAAAELAERGEVTAVTPEAFAAAVPDPLADREANLLCHLVSAHADLVAWLARLVPADRLHGVRRVHPLRLDRYGIELRLEFPSRERDVRLWFSSPAETAGDAPSRLLELLARARACRRARPTAH